MGALSTHDPRDQWSAGSRRVATYGRLDAHTQYGDFTTGRDKERHTGRWSHNR